MQKFTPTLTDLSDLELLSNANLGVALNNTGIGLWELNLTDFNLRCTHACKQCYGRSKDEVFDYDAMIATVYAEDVNKVQQAIARAIAEPDEGYHVQYRVLWPDGAMHWIKADGACIIENDRALKIAGITVDITDQKTAEAKHEELLSIVSHEVNTPLTSIKGYLQLLERLTTAYEQNAKISQIIDRTGKSAERLKKIINDYIGKVTSDDFAQRNQLFCVDDLIGDVLEDIQATISTHTIHKSNVCIATLQGDRQQIGQVLSNLLTNAIKYSPNRNSIEVSTSLSDGFVTVSVRDFGLGIAKKDIKYLFNKQFRVDNGGKIDGTGMGLYICEQIIKKHNGYLSVESTEGMGSVFSFSLPVLS